MNLKLFCIHAGIYRFEKKFKKYSGEIKDYGGNQQYLTWELKHSSKKMRQQKMEVLILK